MGNQIELIQKGTTPPSLTEVVETSKQIARDVYAKIYLEDFLYQTPSDTRNREDLIRYISAYSANEPTLSSRSLWISNRIVVSSTKNTDGTISYWLQYPVGLVHVKAAILKLLNIPITPNALEEVSSHFSVLIQQAATILKNVYVKCDHVDPLFIYGLLLATPTVSFIESRSFPLRGCEV